MLTRYTTDDPLVYVLTVSYLEFRYIPKIYFLFLHMFFRRRMLVMERLQRRAHRSVVANEFITRYNPK